MHSTDYFKNSSRVWRCRQLWRPSPFLPRTQEPRTNHATVAVRVRGPFYALCGRHSLLAPVLSFGQTNGRTDRGGGGGRTNERSDGLSDGQSHVFKRRSGAAGEQGIYLVCVDGGHE